MNKFIKHLLICTIGIVPIFFASCEKDHQKPKDIIRPVRYTRVSSSSPIQQRTFSGVAKVGVESKLSFKVSGTINRIGVKVGDEIPRGGFIASVDDVDYELQLQTAQANLDRAQAAEQNAASVYERTRQLYEKNNVSRSEFDAARADFESKKAAFVSLKKQLELARRQKKYTELKSPITCSIAAVNVEENENVQNGQGVVIASCGNQAEVDVGVPESVISQIKDGSIATVAFDAFPGKTFEAVVTEVGVAVTGSSSTFPVTVQLTTPNPNVRSGMAAEVTFSLEPEDNEKKFILDPVAVKEDLNGRFVFVVEPADEGLGIVRKRIVKPGKLLRSGLEIMEGLKEGELVVTAGASRLQDGVKVKLLKSMEK